MNGKGFRLAGQNKAVNHELITGDSKYQQLVALYDVMVDAIKKDPRLLTDTRLRDNISRSQNLLHGESTALFRPALNKLQEYVGQTPDPRNISYDALKSLLVKPNNIFVSEANNIKGWHGAEVHHLVPAAQMASQTSALPYKQWGAVMQGAGANVPITSSSFNGLGNRSGPGHQLSHLDLLGRQFYKGETGGGSLILPGTSTEEAIYQLTDSANTARLISQVGGQADDVVFLPELAEAISALVGREVKPAEFSSTLYSPHGRGKTEAAHLREYTSENIVNDMTQKAYGGLNTDGATEYLNQTGAAGLIKTADERRLERNAKARALRANPPSTAKSTVKSTAATRPDFEQTLASAGFDPDVMQSLRLR